MNKPSSQKSLLTVAEIYEALQSTLDRLISERDEIIVLEAGCGSSTYITLPADASIVGIDISPEQLERNEYLKEKILGDIQTYELDEDRFDLIISWNVLEHLQSPEKVLNSFVRALKPNGLMLLALPNVYSLKGLITKLTPHWFHVWVYRRIYGYENAGKPGYAPFKTFLRPSISAGAFQKFVSENKLAEEFISLHEGSMVAGLKNRLSLPYVIYKIALWLMYAISFGTYDGSKSDMLFLLRKPKD